MVYATSNTNVNAGNNNYWVFVSTGLTRYWVASTPKNWSDATAWSLTSGGGGGALLPFAAKQVSVARL